MNDTAASVSSTSKVRAVLMDRVDAAEFSAALRAAFANIQYLADDYTGQKLAAKAPGAVGRIKPKSLLIYRTGLDDIEEKRFWVWVEPPGWRPQWERWTDHSGRKIWRLSNEPKLKFHFDRSFVGSAFPHNMLEGRIWATYASSDAEQRSFLNKVWRLSEKLTSDWLDALKNDGEHWFTGKTGLWVGRHALRWCAASPKRRLAGHYRPPSTPQPKKLNRSSHRSNP